MTSATQPSASHQALSLPSRFPFYYGWINLLIAAVAMTATLPGRTHGLGLITEPMLADLNIDPVRFASLNFCASVVGAALGLLAGPLIDRWGTRLTLFGTAVSLGVVVCWMSSVRDEWSLLASLTLTRGLGQSALSVVSMAIVGKWFHRRVGLAMGVYSVLLAIGFIITTLTVGYEVQTHGWREVWWAVGTSLWLGLAPLGLLVVRSTPEGSGISREELSREFAEVAATETADGPRDFTLREALCSRVFWTFAAGTSAFNLIWSAVTLFYQSILEERGFPAAAFLTAMSIMTGVGLLTNLFAGWLAIRMSLGKLLAVGLFLLAPTLWAFPHLKTDVGVALQGFGLGVAGGIVTVVFFSVWGSLFGRRHLGKIQSTAQVLSVLASSSGPWLLAASRSSTGSSDLFFQCAAVVVVVLACGSWWVPSLARALRSAP